jgi:hypothetical protein
MRFPLKTTVDFRACGDCQACCTILGIKELGKPPWTRCEHQCDRGCNIYEDRPETCRGYSCLWQAGLLDGDERRRPDKFGVIFDVRVEGSEYVRPGDAVTVQAWEVWPGALEQPNVLWLLNRIRERYPLVIRSRGGATDGDPQRAGPVFDDSIRH